MTEQPKTGTKLATSSLSKNWQTAIVREVRPHLKVEPGDRLQWLLIHGDVVVRKAK